jgi:hypothetical protein
MRGSYTDSGYTDAGVCNSSTTECAFRQLLNPTTQGALHCYWYLMQQIQLLTSAPVILRHVRMHLPVTAHVQAVAVGMFKCVHLKLCCSPVLPVALVLLTIVLRELAGPQKVSKQKSFCRSDLPPLPFLFSRYLVCLLCKNQ